MRIMRTTIVFDAADIETESAFWAGVVDGEVDKEADWHRVRSPDGPAIAVQLAPDHRPPQWPDGLPQQIHLDLWIEDVDAAERQVVALGARPLKSVDEQRFRVYADPAGHPFCLCW